MIDFELTEEQKLLQRTAHEFAEKEIRPIAMEVDADPDPNAALRMKEVIMKGLRLGFGKLLIPEKYGGAGRTVVDSSILLEELAWGDIGIVTSLALNPNFIPYMISKGAPEEQKERWLRYFAEDETGERIVAGMQTEPTGGSETMCPLPNPEMGLRTTAVRDGNDYIINGTKCFITGAAMAKIAMIVARTDKTKPNFEGMTFFMTPTDNPGFEVGRVENKTGCRCSHNTEVIFDNMRVPAEDVLGTVNGGAELAASQDLAEGVSVGAMVVGLARAIYEEALAYAKQRIIWGKPLSEFEHVQHKLIDMATKIAAMRGLVWQIAWAADNPDKATAEIMNLSNMAKVWPSSLIWGIAEDAFHIMGGYAYMKPFLLEKLMRDALIWPVSGFPNELKLWFTAQKLLK